MTFHSLITSLISIKQNQYYDPLTNKTFDLAYILPNLIVCSGPVDDQLHKHHKPNRMDEFTRFLDLKHGRGNYKFYNFRSEKLGYTNDVDLKLAYFPFVDHEAPPFQLILKIINSIDLWLSCDDKHVAVLHCKAGKGRSGTIACCYLMFKDNRMTPNAANEYFSKKRFNDIFSSYGVSILSQRRYINYYYHYLNNPRLHRKIDLLEEKIIGTKIKKITLVDAIDGSILIDLKIYNGKDLSNCAQLSNPQVESSSMMVYHSDLLIEATDIRVSFRHFLIDSSSIKLPTTFCFLWFNSSIDLYGSKYLTNSSSSINRILTDDNVVVLQNSKKLSWDEFDGFMGTYHRGLALFKSMEITYEVHYRLDENDEDYVATCRSDQPMHGSHLRRILTYHRNREINT